MSFYYFWCVCCVFRITSRPQQDSNMATPRQTTRQAKGNDKTITDKKKTTRRRQEDNNSTTTRQQQSSNKTATTQQQDKQQEDSKPITTAGRTTRGQQGKQQRNNKLICGLPLFCSLQFTEWAAMETRGCNAHGATGGASAQDMLQRIAHFTLLMLIARQTRPPSYSAVGASTIRCSRSVKPKIKNRWARHFARPNALGLLQVSFHHRRDPLMEDLIEQVPARRDHDREALEDDTDENPKAQPTKPRQHLRNAWDVEPES